MEGEQFLARYAVPRTHPAHLPRERLFRRLDEGLQPGHLLILIVAPAGSGKTTLLGEWVAARRQKSRKPNWQFCWLSLGRQDNSPHQFLLRLIAALQTVNPALGRTSKALLSAPFVAGFNASFKEIVALLVHDLASSHQQLAFVLEDYHLVTEPKVHELLTALMERTPDTFRWVLTSRTQPPLPLLRWRGRGQLVELGAADLRFTAKEIETYLNQRMNCGISSEDVVSLNAHVGGLAAAVRLSAAVLQQRGHPVEWLSGFSGGRFLLENLLDEALHYQPQIVSDFLLQTSILRQLTGDLCDAVTGQQNSAALLEELAGQDLFLAPLDPEGRWYRYPPLFGELLRSRLSEYAERLEGGVAVFHQRASAWFEANGFLSEAVEHSLAAADYRRAIALIERFADRAIFPAENDILLDWIQTLPGELACARLRLCVIRAWGLLTAARTEEADSTVQDAVHFAPAHTDAIQGEAIALRTLAASPRGAAAVIPLAEQALQQLPPETVLLRSEVLLALGKAQESQDDLEAAAVQYEQACETAQKTNDFTLQLAAFQLLGDNYLMRARLREAEATYRRALQITTSTGEVFSAAAMLLTRLAKLAYEWNDLVLAEDYLCEALQIGERCECADVQAMALTLQALIRAVQGDAEEATRLNYRAGRYLREHIESLMTVAAVRALQARVWAMIGKADMAASWAETVWAERNQVSTYQRELEGAVWGQIMLRRYQPAAIIQPLADLAQAAGLLGHTHHLIELLALHGLGLHIVGQKNRAGEIIQRALRLAEPGGYIRTFVDCGAEMAHLLRQITPPPPQPEYLEQLLAAFENSPKTQPSAVPPETGAVSPAPDAN